VDLHLTGHSKQDMRSHQCPLKALFFKKCPYNYSGIVETRGSHLYLVLRSNSEFYATHIRRVWRYHTKVVIRIYKSKKDRQHNDKNKGQKGKQLSTKHYTENWRSSNTNPTIPRGELGCSWRI